MMETLMNDIFKNEIKNCYIGYNEDTKKKIIKFGEGHKSLPKSKSNATFMNMPSNAFVIDLDTKDLSNYNFAKFLPKKPTVETARGYHYYFELDTDAELATVHDNDKKFDVQCENAVIVTSYAGDEPKEHISYEQTGKVYKLSDYKTLEVWLKETAPKVRHRNNDVERGDVGQMNKKEVKRLVSKLNILDFKGEFEWKKALAAIYHAGGNKAYKIAKKWSQGDKEEYDEHYFDNYWDRLETGDFGEDISAGTLYHLAGEKAVDPTSKFNKEKGSVKPLSKKEKKKRKTDFDHYIQKEILLKIDDIERTPLTKCLFNQSLHMFHGLSGVGKSYAVVTEMEQVDKKHKYYIDIELNGGELQTRCEDNGIKYTPSTTGIEMINHILKSDFDLSETIIAIDSFNNFVPDELSQKDSDDVAGVVRKMHEVCIKKGATIIIIDHSTALERDNDGNPIPKKVKVEGNATGKEKNLDFAYRVVPNDMGDQTKGVYLVCEKTRTPEYVKKYEEIQLQESYFKDENSVAYNNSELKLKTQRKWYEKNFENIEIIKQAVDEINKTDYGVARDERIAIETGIPAKTLKNTLNKMKFYEVLKLKLKKMNGNVILVYKVNKKWSHTTNKKIENPKGGL